MKIIYWLLTIALATVIGASAWKIDRVFHYKYGYENAVKEAIRDLVKPECLKP